MARTRSSHRPHLVVLIHGLWGNPKHFDYIVGAIRERYSEDQLHILVTSCNSSNYTYDGIEVGGERVTHEIEGKLRDLEGKGQSVRRLSIVGYSLGGLIARYAIGLLYHKQWFDKLEPVNFTTFATPHLGARTPLLGYINYLWNMIGAHTVSMSGKQLFLIDSYRDTNRPVLSILAEPNSVFMKGLAAFKHRILYANIINDKKAPFYTTGITPNDPFSDLESIDIKYEPAFEPVILSQDAHVPRAQDSTSEHMDSTTSSCSPGSSKIGSSQASIMSTTSVISFVASIPSYFFIAVIFPVAALLWFSNSAYQSALSSSRIRAHHAGRTGIQPGFYSVPLAFEGIQRTADNVYTDMSSSIPQAELSENDSITQATDEGSAGGKSQHPDSGIEGRSAGGSPTLALTPEQFAMVDSLGSLKFEKYPVHIHLAKHSHAAIIVRKPKPEFREGKVVVRHWLDRFEL